MKKNLRNLTTFAMVLLLLVGVSCKNNDIVLLAETTTYNFEVRDLLGVSGTITFTETSSTTVTVDIDLKGAPSGTHHAEICGNSAVEGGATLVVLNPLNTLGKSTTVTSAITYKQILALDGFVQVYLGGVMPKSIVAIADIGGNVITDTQITYQLSTAQTFVITGSALFQKRTNGNTLVTLSMNGLLPNTFYPATINVGSVATVGGGGITKVLQDVNGDTGKSFTNIRSLDNNVIINYENWLVYVGYINVYHTDANNDNIISQGNIGANAVK